MAPSEPAKSVIFFVNGEGMRGGRLNEGLGAARFLGPTRTAPHYRFYSVRDEFPGISPVADRTGHHISGEAYEVDYETLRAVFLPNEPPELELGVIALEGLGGSLSMVMRREHVDAEGVKDISAEGGWRAYRGLPNPEDSP